MIVEDNGGNEAEGLIAFIRQSHTGAAGASALPAALSTFALDPARVQAILSTPEADPQHINNAIVRNQFLNFQLLRRLGPTDIFPEGQGEDFSLAQEQVRSQAPFDEIYLWETPHGRVTATQIRQAFVTVPEDDSSLSREQSQYLHDLGASRVYAVLHENVVLHQAESEDLNRAGVQQMSGLTRRILESCLHRNPPCSGADVRSMMLNDRQFREAAIDRRERFLAERLTSVMRDPTWRRNHPRRRVVVEFGADHDFTDDLRAIGLNPRVLSVRFPTHLQELREEYSRATDCRNRLQRAGFNKILRTPHS